MATKFICDYNKEAVLTAISESTELSNKILSGKASQLNSSLEVGQSSDVMVIEITNIKGKKTFKASQDSALSALPIWDKPSKTHSLHFFYLQKDSDLQNRSAIHFVNPDGKTKVINNLFADIPVNEIPVRLVCSSFETKEGKIVRAVTVTYAG